MLHRLFYQYIAVPACKVLRELTKPDQSVYQNLVIGLAKVEKNYQQLSVPTKVKLMVGLIGGVYSVGLGLLSFLWYRQQGRSQFHFFNDNPEWQQMDKFGHFFTAFHLSRLVCAALQIAGLRKKEALRYGGWAGAVMMTPIEILDGFSEGYGASWGDEVANIAGSAFFIWQQHQWDEIRCQPKFTFSPSPYAALRPSLLGKNLAEQWLKDYNGQTYWFTIPIPAPQPPKGGVKTPSPLGRVGVGFPPLGGWGALLIGYGAGNMIYGRPEQNRAAGFEPFRKFYLAIEIKQSLWLPHLLPTKTLRNLADLLAFPIVLYRFGEKY